MSDQESFHENDIEGEEQEGDSGPSDDEGGEQDKSVENDEPDAENTDLKSEVTEHSHSTKKGRGRPPKKQKIKKSNTAEAVTGGKKGGRGRPKKTASVVVDEKITEDVTSVAVEKKGRGRTKKSPVVSPDVEDIDDKQAKVKTGKRGRSKVPTEGEDSSDTPKKKKTKIMRERTIEPGKLRETARLSYKDDSSDEEVNKYFEPEIVSSDGEADLQLERRLSSGKHRPEKKEAGALRMRKRMSYKDDSESDIESGFESDVIIPKKSKSKSPAKKGKGRPKKEESKKKSSGKKRGRKRLHPDQGPYIPTGKPRGRPKGYKNKPKVKTGKTEESLQDTETQEQDNKSENQSTGRESTLYKSEAGEVINEETASGGENELESMNSEENSDEELDESAHSESEEEEIKDSSAPVVEAAV